jgi:hypothetical protein
MRVSRLVSVENWQYAVGEVVLIVVGITIALAANTWYEQQREHRDEILVLEQIEESLNADLALFVENFKTMQRSEQEIVALLAHLEAGDPYSASLDPYFRSAIRWRGIRIRSAPYEELKNRGFDLISDSSLRNRLIDFYEFHFPALLGPTNIDREFSIKQVLPYFMSHFRQTDAREWIPNDYSILRSDPYFANLLRMKLFRLRDFLLPQYETNVETIQDILTEITNTKSNSS